MRSYKVPFFLAAVAALVFGVAAVYLWLRPMRPTDAKQMAASPGAGPRPMQMPDAKPAAPASETGAEAALAPIQLTPQRIQAIGVKTGAVQTKTVRDEIRTVGNVDVDEARLAYVQVRFSGWIQRVFADATFQRVRQGQPLFTIYSPDLVTTEQEYLLAKDNRNLLVKSTLPGVASGAESLLSSAAERLAQWEIPEREIAELENTGKIRRELEIDSPVSGFITERNALPNMYVQPGTKLYTLADLSTVWVDVQVFQNDIGRVKVGDAAAITVDAYPGRWFPGRVNFIWPQVDEATRTVKVRLEIPNREMKLSLGMFVNARLDLSLGRQLVVPASGVFQTGLKQIAFVDHGGGYFEPREIEAGARAGDDIIVLHGLKAGEQVVTSANFLIDSESQLQAALGSFAPPPPGAGAAAAMNAPAAQIEYSSQPATLHRGTNSFLVKLTAADGTPITGAQVTVTFFMPAMPSMGMAAMRTVTTLPEKGGGLYEGPGQVQTGGPWQVTVVATRSGKTLAQKQFNVIAEGGMR